MLNALNALLGKIGLQTKSEQTGLLMIVNAIFEANGLPTFNDAAANLVQQAEGAEATAESSIARLNAEIGTAEGEMEERYRLALEAFNLIEQPNLEEIEKIEDNLEKLQKVATMAQKYLS